MRRCGRYIHLCIVWRSARDHLEGFRKGPHFPPFLELIRPFIGEMVEMRHYEPTAVTWRRAYKTRRANSRGSIDRERKIAQQQLFIPPDARTLAKA